MTVLAARAGPAGGEPPVGPGRAAGAQPGDTVVIDGAGMAGLPRTGTIIAVSQDGEPPYLIRWTAGDYDSWFTPGLGARIEKHPEHPASLDAGRVIQCEQALPRLAARRQSPVVSRTKATTRR